VTVPAPRLLVPAKRRLLFLVMSSSTQLSLEPLQPFAGDGHDSDLFARPARLHEVRLDDGREVFTRCVLLPRPSLSAHR